jgi:hypothetical protein
MAPGTTRHAIADRATDGISKAKIENLPASSFAMVFIVCKAIFPKNEGMGFLSQLCRYLRW